MIDKPYWYRVLYYFERKGYFWNGLTIPFLIGSRFYIEPTEGLQTVSQLIDEVNNSVYYVSVLKCGGIGEYVFSLSNKTDKEIYGGFDNLVIIDNSFEKATESSEIIRELETKYLDYIDSGLFSKNDGEWGDFTEKDKNRLKEVNNNY